jgi:hypothetical protein
MFGEHTPEAVCQGAKWGNTYLKLMLMRRHKLVGMGWFSVEGNDRHFYLYVCNGRASELPVRN